MCGSRPHRQPPLPPAEARVSGAPKTLEDVVRSIGWEWGYTVHGWLQQARSEALDEAERVAALHNVWAAKAIRSLKATERGTSD